MGGHKSKVSRHSTRQCEYIHLADSGTFEGFGAFTGGGAGGQEYVQSTYGITAGATGGGPGAGGGGGASASGRNYTQTGASGGVLGGGGGAAAFSFGQGQQNFSFAAFKLKSHRHEGVALFIDLAV